jgi:hypothetical protein
MNLWVQNNCIDEYIYIPCLMMLFGPAYIYICNTYIYIYIYIVRNAVQDSMWNKKRKMCAVSLSGGQ